MSSRTYLDVAEAVRQLRHACLEHGLKPPRTIVLGEEIDIERLLSSMAELLHSPPPGPAITEAYNTGLVLYGIDIIPPSKLKLEERP
jgi:hypothetical protein